MRIARNQAFELTDELDAAQETHSSWAELTDALQRQKPPSGEEIKRSQPYFLRVRPTHL
jgi:hypothetical protein